jgi:hypothetical protein
MSNTVTQIVVFAGEVVDGFQVTASGQFASPSVGSTGGAGYGFHVPTGDPIVSVTYSFGTWSNASPVVTQIAFTTQNNTTFGPFALGNINTAGVQTQTVSAPAGQALVNLSGTSIVAEASVPTEVASTITPTWG